jgi:hypothetical protein
VIVLKIPNFRHTLDQHADLSSSVSNHHGELRRGTSRREPQQDPEINKGNHDSAKIRHSDQHRRHSRNGRDRLDLEHFPNVAQVNGIEFPAQADQADSTPRSSPRF